MFNYFAIDQVPIIIETTLSCSRTVPTTQPHILAILGEGFRKLIDCVRLNQSTIDALLDQVLAARSFRSNDGQARRHGFKCDVTKSLGH